MGQRILVADDEEGIVLLLKDYFELQGYEVITAGGGMEALDRIRCGPDMIILDINMPDLDGLSVCRKIRVIRTVWGVGYQWIGSTTSDTGSFCKMGAGSIFAAGLFCCVCLLLAHTAALHQPVQ